MDMNAYLALVKQATEDSLSANRKMMENHLAEATVVLGNAVAINNQDVTKLALAAMAQDPR